jgi:hypothetical protein
MALLPFSLLFTYRLRIFTGISFFLPSRKTSRRKILTKKQITFVYMERTSEFALPTDFDLPTISYGVFSPRPGALGATSDKLDEHKHDTAATANKHSI